MDKPSVTLQHIAQATGVSKMTVSMALRNHPRIAAATRARIQAQAAAMGYRRIGLVTSFSLARTTEHQEEAAFLYYAMRLRQAPIPILVFRSWESATFLTWFHKHRPDVHKRKSALR